MFFRVIFAKEKSVVKSALGQINNQMPKKHPIKKQPIIE